MNLRVPLNAESSWVAAQIAASQEGLSSMKLEVKAATEMGLVGMICISASDT
jgi:hypothetical protein